MTLDRWCDRTPRRKSNKNRPSVTKNRGSFPDAMKIEEDFGAMLQNEPGQFLGDSVYQNPETGETIIFEEYDCPYCVDGDYCYTDSEGVEHCDRCEECDGEGTISVRVE